MEIEYHIIPTKTLPRGEDSKLRRTKTFQEAVTLATELTRSTGVSFLIKEFHIGTKFEHMIEDSLPKKPLVLPKRKTFINIVRDVLRIKK